MKVAVQYLQAGWQAPVRHKFPFQPLGPPVLPRDGEEGRLHPAGNHPQLLNTELTLMLLQTLLFMATSTSNYPTEARV